MDDLPIQGAEVLKLEEIRPGPLSLSRQQLFSLVWQEPISRLAARFGISDVALAKRCRYANVPIPPRGYWARLRAGKKVAQAVLPTMQGSGYPIRFVVVDPTQVREKTNSGSDEAENARPRLQVPVGATLSRPHPLVELTRTALHSQKESVPLVLRRNLPPQQHLDLRDVAKGSVGRALRILDALVKGLECRGHRVYVEKGWSYIAVGKQRFQFYVKEVYDRHLHSPTERELARQKRDSWYKPPSHDFVSVGNLAIHLDTYDVPRKTWADGKRQRLDEILGEVIEGIEENARIRQQRDDIWAARMRADEEARRQLAIIAQRERDEAARAATLVTEAQSWELSKTIRGYIEAVRTAAEARGHAGDPDVRRWIDWAGTEARKHDPLEEGLPAREAEWDLPPDFGDGHPDPA